MWDFLTFRRFVTPSVLFIVYYLGALGVPLLAAYLSRLARQRLPQLFAAASAVGQASTDYLPGVMPARWKVLLVFAVLFVAMELAWRMLFEFVIAYFQMREALMTLSGS